MTELPKEQTGKSWLLAASIAAIVLVALFLITAWRSHRLVLGTIDYVVQNLAMRSGSSPFLVRGIVILVTIPFFWAVVKYTHGLFWLHGVHPSLRLYRNPYGMIIVAYAGLFFIAMYFASRDAYAYKWCADTPEGIRTFDAPGIDPVYGLPLNPCRFDQIVSLRQTQKGFAGPQRVQIGDAHKFKFFDPITGVPRIWYYKLPSGAYEFYDRLGKFPGTGEDLRPVDRVTIQEVARLQEAAEAQRQKQEMDQTTSARQREKQAFDDRFINTAIVNQAGSKQVAILVLRERQDTPSVSDADLSAALSKAHLEPLESFFKAAFISEGYGNKLLAGDWSQVEELEVKKRVSYIVSETVDVKYSSASQFEGLISASLHLELRCLNVATEKACGSQTIDAIGAGYNNVSALQNAVSKCGAQFESFAKSLRID